MENASIALIIAGSILIGLLVIGALILMYDQIGDYEKAQSNNDKNSQLAEFNNDFERYLDDKGINGTDVLSLINKVANYNNKAKNGGVANSVNYDIKMSITVSGLTEFNKKYAYDGSNEGIFVNDSYTFDKNSTNNKIKKVLDNCSKADENLGIEGMKKVAYVYDASKTKNDNIKNIREKLKEINESTYKNWNGTSPSPTLDTIKKYRQYSEFKSSTFVQDKNVEYQNGQIKNIYLKFKE